MADKRFLFQQSEGYAEEAHPGDYAQLGKVVLHGIDGVALDLNGTAMQNVAWPVFDQDLANKDYVDTTARNGLQIHEPVSAASNTNVDLLSAPAYLDGYLLVPGDRVLIKNQDDLKQNGVYVFNGAGSAFTRASDPYNGGDYFWVNHGTLNFESAWVLTTSAPILLGTSDLEFDQFTGLGQVIAGNGLIKSGNQLDVGYGNGIRANSDSIEVHLDDPYPALGLFGLSPNKKLAWKPDTTRGLDRGPDGGFVKTGDTEPGLKSSESGLNLKVDSDGGLQLTVDGLALKLADPNELYLHLNFLRVAGLPANFKVAGVPTGNFLTAERLTANTSGANASVLGLHTHTPQQECGDVVETWPVLYDVPAGCGVYVGDPDKISKAGSGTDASSRVVGVAPEFLPDGSTGRIMVSGIARGVLGGGGIPNTRYFLGNDGRPVQITLVPGGNRCIQLGIGLNTDDLLVCIHDFGRSFRYGGLPARAVTDTFGNLITTTSGEEVTY